MDKKEPLFNKILPHIIIVISLMLITFIMFNFFNPYMQFLDNRFNQIMLIVVCVLNVVQSGILIAKTRKNK